MTKAIAWSQKYKTEKEIKKKQMQVRFLVHMQREESKVNITGTA